MHDRFNRRTVRLTGFVGALVLVMTLNLGCFSERSVRLDPHEAIRLSPDGHATAEGVSTRDWLRHTHEQLASLLPQAPVEPLLTEQLSNGDGQAIDVFGHFGIERKSLQSIIKNFRGLLYSGQAASRDYYVERQAPPWPGFEDVWIPIHLVIDEELALSGRLGYARDEQGNIRDADCIVILPGMFGDHGVKRSADLAIPLRESGFHVLHLEIRGHGQTEHRYPRMYHCFGVAETDDLMQVSDWLESLPHVRRTGLIGYCWNANIALLSAWFDGRQADDGLISDALRPYLPAYNPERRRFRAGIIAFSPVVRWENLMDELDRPRSRLGSPIFAAIQDTIRDRMVRKNFPNPDGNLRRLVQLEYEGYNLGFPNGAKESYPFLRLMPYKGETAGDKLDRARMPVLIVHGADDPLVPVQDVADMVAGVRNPKVAAVILPSGGHVGFAGYARQYYLSLITNFFDPQTGPAASMPPAMLTESHKTKHVTLLHSGQTAATR